MFNRILSYGTIAGLIVGVPLFAMTVGMTGHRPLASSLILGYAIMLVALSAVFVGIKRYRDVDLGGVISFWTALGLGIGISIVAGIFYVAAWEAAVAVAHLDFARAYAHQVIAEAKARGESAAAIAKLSAQMEAFRAQYADPLYRLPMSFAEIFPVGVLVSLVSAGLLANRKFLPLRRA